MQSSRVIPWVASQAPHSSLPLGTGYLVSTTVKASPYHENLRETYSCVLRRAGILHTLAEDPLCFGTVNSPGSSQPVGVVGGQ